MPLDRLNHLPWLHLPCCESYVPYEAHCSCLIAEGRCSVNSALGAFIQGEPCEQRDLLVKSKLDLQGRLELAKLCNGNIVFERSISSALLPREGMCDQAHVP